MRKRDNGYVAARQVNPLLKNYYQVNLYKGLSDSNFFLVCVDAQSLELLYSLKEPQYHARWLKEDGERIESDEDKKFVDRLWEKLQGQLSDIAMLNHFIRAALLNYSGLTGEEVNFDLNDPDNILNSTGKFTSTTPFYVPKKFLPDMSIANAIYRATTTERNLLYDAQYPAKLPGIGSNVNGVPLTDILAGQANADPTTLLQIIADTLAAVNGVAQGTQTTANNTANNQADLVALLTDLVAKGGDAAILEQIATSLATMNQVATATKTTADNTANNQQDITDLLTDLVAKGGDAAILQKIDTSLADIATLGQGIKDMNTLYATKLTDLINRLNTGGGAGGIGNSTAVSELTALLETMKAVQAVASTAIAAAEWSQVGLDLIGQVNETTQTAIAGTMAIEETMDKVTDEVVDATQAISQAATAIGTLANAMGTWAGVITNMAGFYSVRNAIGGVTSELQKLNANIGGPGSGDGWFAWLKYNFWGGTPPPSYQPTLNDIAAAHLQATREINEIQGGNPNLNDADSINYIGEGGGTSAKP